MGWQFLRDFDHPWVSNGHFIDVTADDLLRHCQGAVPRLDGGRPRAWVFDLDSTLFCLGPRIKNIFRDFLRAHEAPPEHWLWAYGQMDPHQLHYDTRLSFRRIFSERDSAQADLWAKELWAAFRDHWFKEFFSSRHSHFDRPYSGAPAFVRTVHELGDTVVYLTGRDLPLQRRGTVDALRTHGFPWGWHCELIMKPVASMDDMEFKRTVARDLNRRYDVALLIDNEPENLVMFAQTLPQAPVVHFHSIMSARIPQHNYVQALGERAPLRLHSYSRGQQ